MKWSFKQITELFNKKSNYRLLADSRHGLERECLRITKKGKLAQTPHPKNLGSKLTNPYITTDFSEAQLELITPAFNREEKALKFLEDVHLFINKHNPDELLWPFSMPCRLPSEKHIPLAQYGKSYTGKKKTLYRLGLSYRYGRKMQTVSGTHYNFSFSDNFWNLLHKTFAQDENKKKFISDNYFALIRNFLRYGWLNTYLFGAAPVVDKSYLKKKHPALKKCDWRSCYNESATSFRMSDLGYYSKVQKQLAISFNDLGTYIQDLKYAISTPSDAYKDLPGLNTNILQIENEHYSRIRPKQVLKEKETPLKALSERGVKYVEVRAVDINPFTPFGLMLDQMCFLHVFLIYCLFKPSNPLAHEDQKCLTANQNKVAFYGRKEGLTLVRNGKEFDMKKYAKELLNEMKIVAETLDQNFKTPRYTKSLNMQLAKIENPNLTPSALILKEMHERSKNFQKFGLALANEHKQRLTKQTLLKDMDERLSEIAKKSVIDQENLEIKEETLLDGHEDMEVSTQILIKEAKKRNIKVEILDRKENFIKLSKGRKIEYVKQATKTSIDSYVTYLIMENKHVSKHVLAENGIKVPQGKLFSNPEEAIESYKDFEKMKVAVKPTLTNFGIGISFVEPKSPHQYTQAVKEAFQHGKTVIVEEFIDGQEYRFLTIDYKTVSILNRIPANVTGDGIHNIRQLIEMKNADPRNYKFFNDYYLRTGKVEAEHLRQQKLNFKSILEKGRQIFLRSNSNVSTGGDPIDVTDQIPEKYKRIAEAASRAVKARICGIDMIIGKNDYAILEVNFNPALQMHEYPVKGKRCHVAEKVLDLLGF